MTELEPWWEIATPHEDIRQGEFPEAVFAIDLGSVVNGTAPNVYQDPVEFYKKTHVTNVLEDLVTNVIENLGGHPSGNRIKRLQTGFGGGKTHLLLAIYHLLNSPSKVENIEKIRHIIDESAVETIPESEVAVLVGTDLNTSEGREIEGTRIRTLWGEIAYQLGGQEAYEIIETSDQNLASPGKDQMVDVFKSAGPSVLLVDELLQYVLRAQAIEVGGSNLGEQTISFIDELFGAIGIVEDVFAVVSLQASERYEMFGDPEKAEEVLNQLESKGKRVDSVDRPIQGSEINNIVRQRLFDDIGDSADHQTVAQAYADYYNEHRSDFPSEVVEPGYREEITEAYPFHPEFIRTLYRQWGSMPNFQRTRGVLRFLAKVVADQYRAHHQTPLIQPGQLNMADALVRDEALDYLEEGWDSVIESDIAGEDSKAAQIDQQLGGVWHRRRVTQRLAASLFLYSVGGGQEQRLGADIDRLRLGTLQPEMDTPLVADALNRCEDTFYYLREDDGLYRFSKQPNLNRVISDYEGSVDPDDREDEIRDTLPEVIGNSSFTVHIWPSDSSSIPDDHALRLAVMNLDVRFDSGSEDAMDTVEKIWKNHGEEFRTYKNCLAFLAVDADDVADIRESATTKIALREIRNSPARRSELTEQQEEELENRWEDSKDNLISEIRTAYTEAAVPSESGLERLSTGNSHVPSEKGIDELLEDTLKEQDKLLSKLAGNLIISDRWGIWPTNEDEEREDYVTTAQLWGYFGQLTELPILESEEALKKCIAEAVDDEGRLGYATLNDGEYTDLVFEQSLDIGEIEISDTTVVLREAVARRIEEETSDGGEGEIEEPLDNGETEDENGDTDEGGLGPFVGGEGGKDELEGGGSGSTPVHAVDSVQVNVSPNWEDEWEPTYEAVIAELVRLGADVELTVTVEAESDTGLDRSKIERQIEENLRQRGIKFDIQYGDEEEDQNDTS